MLIDTLLSYLFDGQSHLLVQPMATWLKSSRRFTAFVNTFRDKIRKKLRTIQDQETLLDLQLELETAYLLLQEERLSLVYEPQQSAKFRRPDFAVTFTTSLTFMVEVTRLRTNSNDTLAEVQEQIPAPPASNTNLSISFVGESLTDAIGSKLSQLIPQRSNVLLVAVETSYVTQETLRAAMLNLQQRAERNDANVVRRHRFRDRADFFQHYQRLSEVLVRGPELQAGEPVIGWINPQAKYPLPSKVRTALYRSHKL